jgi:hypothetical protein
MKSYRPKWTAPTGPPAEPSAPCASPGHTGTSGAGVRRMRVRIIDFSVTAH